MRFADKIKKYRHQRNWTQQEAAQRLKISPKTISSWENSRSYPDIFMLVQISDLYHVSLDDLLRKDHAMINNYHQEHIEQQKNNCIFTIAYIINVIVVLWGLLRPGDYLPLPSWLSNIGGLLMIISTSLLVILTDWHQLKTNYGFWLTLLILVIIEGKISSLSAKQTPSNIANYFGYVAGLYTGAFLVAFCITCVIYLYPQFKERRRG